MGTYIQKALRIFDKNFNKLQNLEKKVMGIVMASDIYPIIHSIKTRIKSRQSLKNKIKRKNLEFSSDSFFQKVTDLVGVRLLILYPQHFKDIHNFIIDEVKSNRWTLHEEPRAYTWDKDMKSFFKDNLNILSTRRKDSMYSSVHYVIKFDKDGPCCEIQVRTLLEEAWGEIDHDLNYPIKHKHPEIQKQLKVLALIVDAGIKLAKSIYDFKI